MTLPHPVVFLVDVDNTLLDNDRIQQDLKHHLERAFGLASRERYWRILEDLFASWVIATISEPSSVTGSNTRTR